MIEKKDLYKLPYTKNDNPNGWIEPTTSCQLSCPFCYRKTDKSDRNSCHRNLAELKQEIDELIEKRNIQTISIGGGEPLLYSELDNLIEYANSKRLNVIIYTNGILVDKKRLVELSNLGATRIIIHIDKYQAREGLSNEEAVNKQRKYFCELFREVGGATLGFIKYISKDNIKDLGNLIDLYKKNADVVKTVVFTALNKTAGDLGDNQSNNDIEADLVFEKVRELFNLDYCAYLKKTKSDNIAWLMAYLIYRDKTLLGPLDNEFVRLYQEEHYKKYGKYSFVSNSNHFSFKIIIHLLLSKIFWKISLHFLKAKGKLKINEQLVLIMNTPNRSSDGWDICDGCPDAMLYSNELVPECLLDRIKAGENIKI